jgi:hypothetical protein
MLEIIAAETTKAFLKGIRKMAKDALLDETQVSFLLSLKSGAEGSEVKYEVCHDYIPVRETTIKEVLGIKSIDLKGYTYFVPPKIKQILEDFSKSLNSNAVEISVHLNRENEESIRYFLYNDTKYVKEFFLEQVLKIDELT